MLAGCSSDAGETRRPENAQQLAARSSQRRREKRRSGGRLFSPTSSPPVSGRCQMGGPGSGGVRMWLEAEQGWVWVLAGVTVVDA
jgi:hypothetical protein